MYVRSWASQSGASQICVDVPKMKRTAAAPTTPKYNLERSLLKSFVKFEAGQELPAVTRQRLPVPEDALTDEPEDDG